MKTLMARAKTDYSGRQLRSRWIAEQFGLEGDAVVAFRGSCRVEGRDLVDLEDFELGNIVAGRDMLHFIVEIFGLGLLGITLAQRLLCGIAREVANSAVEGDPVERTGDDLFVGKGKLSVSVATVSPVSGLIHLGINIGREGVPVEAACLGDLGIDHAWFAGQVMSRFAEEIDSSIKASFKVRRVE